jgi:hypothetical protein
MWPGAGPGTRGCPAPAPQLVQAITEAFTERAAEALERMDVRPAAADPAITARFLAGAVPGVIGGWLSGPAGL